MIAQAQNIDSSPTASLFFAGAPGKRLPLGFRLQLAILALLMPVIFVLAVIVLALVGIAASAWAICVALFDWEPIGNSHPSIIKAAMRAVGVLKDR